MFVVPKDEQDECKWEWEWEQELLQQPRAALTYTHAYVYAIAKMQGIYYFITLLHVSFFSLSFFPSLRLFHPRYVFYFVNAPAVVSRAIRPRRAINQRSEWQTRAVQHW